MTNHRQRPEHRSQASFDAARQLIPGGVNSPVRAFGSVGGTPPVIERGEGPNLYDVDGNRYIDYVMSWGPLILGHAPTAVVEAVAAAAARGTSFGATSDAERELAAIVNNRMPWIERLRLVSSGTEATMTAIRIARAATKRAAIVKFDGGYHGHSDAFLVKAGSGLATESLPASGGVPEAVTSNTISLPYNDAEAVRSCFAQHGADVAAVIVEPVAANMGVILPQPGFLDLLRDLTSQHGAVLIFDEVITGFRVALGGAAERFGIKPDLVCLGKILGGGLPVGGVGGRTDLMELLAPLGPVYQAGTLSGNPLSVAAGSLKQKGLEVAGLYHHLERSTCELADALASAAKSAGVPTQVSWTTGLLTLFFAEHEVRDFATAQACDMDHFARFHRAMLDAGVYLPPSGYEAWFLSTAHSSSVLDRTVRSAEHSLASL